jgi:CheY-like chemotaxis protein
MREEAYDILLVPCRIDRKLIECEGEYPMRILIVDDDPAIRKMIHEVLELEGYESATANDGKEALAYLRASQENHVVMMGGIMPVMDGHHAIEEALQDTQLADRLLFVACSGNGQYLAWAADRLQLPEVAIIQKPFTVDQILDAVAWGVRQLAMRQSNHHA